MARLKENAEYFSHDADMRNDPKIRAVRRKHGFKGYSIWCFLLEVLSDSNHFKICWDSDNIELFAADFDCEVEALLEIVDYFLKLKLIEIEGKCLFCVNLIERLGPLIRKRKRDRRRYSASENDDENNISLAELSKNGDSASEKRQSKGKESKEKVNKSKLEIYMSKNNFDESIEECLESWNLFANENDLPVVRSLSDKRKAAIRARLSEPDFVLSDVLSKIEESPFLLGKTSDWRCNFDFVFCSKNNYLKILEGTYDGKGSKSLEDIYNDI